MKMRLAILLTSLVVSLASGVVEELLEKECGSLGYGESLRCSSCKYFDEIIADPGKSANTHVPGLGPMYHRMVCSEAARG